MALYPPAVNRSPEPVDFGLKVWNFDYAPPANTSIVPTAGLLFGQKMVTRVPTSISSLWTLVTTAGATLTNVGFALYDSAGNLLTSSVNANGATAAAFQATGSKQVTFATPQTINGAFYGAFWFTGTTLPTLQRGSGAGGTQLNPGLSAGSYRFATGTASLTTTAPGTFGTQTAGSIAFWMGAA